jgi:hypothetical protein
MSQHRAVPGESSDNIGIPKWKLLFFSVLILIVQAIIGYATYRAFDKWEERSAFGSMFGAVGTFFSGLAFIGVVYTVFLQRQDLKLQRDELAMTRNELKRSAEAQERSEKALVEQARMMEWTAELTAMNFQAEVCRNKIEFLAKQGFDYQAEQNKWNEIMYKLEGLTQQNEK